MFKDSLLSAFNNYFEEKEKGKKNIWIKKILFIFCKKWNWEKREGENKTFRCSGFSILVFYYFFLVFFRFSSIILLLNRIIKNRSKHILNLLQRQTLTYTNCSKLYRYKLFFINKMFWNHVKIFKFDLYFTELKN